MKPERSYFVIIVFCITAIALTMFLRTMIFKNISEPVPQKEPGVNAPGGSKEKITIYYHERRPYYVTYDDNKVRGLCADPITLVFNTAGIEFKWEKIPPKRQLDIIKENNSPVCAAGWYKTSEREKFAKFTLPIYRDKQYIAIARTDREIIEKNKPIRRILSDRRLRLLVKNGYSYSGFIDNQIKLWDPAKIVTNVENTSMLKMVLYHHADYFFISKEEAEDLVNISDFQNKGFKFVHFSDMPMGSFRYILCSRKVDNHLIKRLNKAIQKTVDLN